VVHVPDNRDTAEAVRIILEHRLIQAARLAYADPGTALMLAGDQIVRLKFGGKDGPVLPITHRGMSELLRSAR
jgi:hypothetical protein